MSQIGNRGCGAGEMGLVEGIGSCAEMRENQLDDCAVFDTRDDFERAGERWHVLMSILNTCLSRCIQGPLLYQKTILSILRLIFCYRHLLPYWIFSSVPSGATDFFFVIKQDFQAFLIFIERLLVSTFVWKQRVDVVHKQRYRQTNQRTDNRHSSSRFNISTLT